jgi:tripartite-type tricarboxylate transporter receptor subunit TctC
VNVLRFILTGIIGLATTISAHAQEEFFKGKTITVINSTGNGGSYYNIAQALTRYMPRHIPGRPTMIVRSMPGGGNLLATNFMYNRAPSDGTHIATINNSIPLHQVLDGTGVHYDASKFQWLGSTGSYNSVAYVWHTAGIRTFKDLLEKEVILGGTGVGSSIVIYPTATNNLLGTKFKIVLGYNSTADIDIAMERGEVEARTGSYTALQSEHPEWLKDKKVIILFQIGNKRDPALPDVPLLTELAKTDEQRDILKLISSPIVLGRPYLAPPNTPADRLGILREAFAATMKDKGFLDEMAKLTTEIAPMSAEEVTQIIADTVNASPQVIAKAKAIVGPSEKSP